MIDVSIDSKNCRLRGGCGRAGVEHVASLQVPLHLMSGPHRRSAHISRCVSFAQL
jgi:hypothetical protein